MGAPIKGGNVKDLIRSNGNQIEEFSEEVREVLERTIAKGQNLTPMEWKLYGHRCLSAGLDPLLNHLYPVKFKKGTPDETLTFITSIDSYRLIAQRSRTGKYGGSSEALYDEELTNFQMLEAKREIPRTATVSVYKIIDGLKVETTATARWKEYYPASKNKQWMWNKMPFMMLAKCAEALALRQAFPLELHGIYTDDEMQQAGGFTPVITDDECIELINKIYAIYDTWDLNEAQVMEKNRELTGSVRLESVPKEQLQEVLKKMEGAE